MVARNPVEQVEAPRSVEEDSASFPVELTPEADEAFRRLRQNSASMVAVLPGPIARRDGETTGITSPIGITLLAVATWALPVIAGVGEEATGKIGQLLLSVVLVLGLSAVHELGHVVAGHAAGLTLLSFTVGPLAVVRTRRGFVPSVNGRWIRFAGCVEHDVPAGKISRLGIATSALGGPAANLALAFLLVRFANVHPFLGTLALWSLVFGSVNLLPIRMNGQTSDGGLVCRLWSDRPADLEWRRKLMGDA